MWEMKEININSEFIKLEQLLKMVDLISSGGESKSFILNNKIEVNDELETRRGRKLRSGDVIKILDQTYKIC